MSRSPVVVDTNVMRAANGQDPEWKPISSACANRLAKIMNAGRICVDTKYLIVKEYGGKLSTSGSGSGDKFFKWLTQNLKNPKNCEQVAITSLNADHTEFAGFPNLKQDLAALIDPSDRKFIAVAHAHPQKPPILQATDSKWIGWKDGLAAAGITVEFIDEAFLRPFYKRKMGSTS